MTLYVNTNIASLRTQAHLNDSTSNLETIYERLSSGYRINTAMDDPAGVQIADRLAAKIQGIELGNRNANDAISFAQTAEGAMDEMTTMLQDIRTTAVQAATGSYTTDDRASLQLEVSAYCEEIDRIAEKTTFAGVSILNGSSGAARFQLNDDPNDIIEIDLSKSYTMISIARQALEDMEETTITVLSDEEFEERFGADDMSAYDDDTEEIFIRQSTAEALVGGQIGDKTGCTSITDDTQGYYVAPTDDGTAGSLTINKWNVDSLINGASTSGDANNIVLGCVFGLEVTGGGEGQVADSATIDVSTSPNAQAAIKYTDEYLAVIDTKRAELGAIQNRLESTIANQENVSENVSEAKSRIMDADYAEEVSNMAAEQIVQQAAAVILTQANSEPEIALTVLSNLNS